MDMMVLTMVMAVTVEALIEYIKSFGKAVLAKEWKTAVTQIVALITSVCLCFAVNADLYSVLGVTFELPWIGCVLTGIFASRGANYVSDIVKKIQELGTSK